MMSWRDDESDELYRRRKAQLFEGVRGTVLEIGPGTGTNFPFLDPDVRWIGVEPNLAMHPYLLSRAEELGRPVELRPGSALDLPVADGAVDAVISTFVLCSVTPLERGLAEIRRVLVPGGRFVFLEHVADEAWTFRWMVQKAAPWTPWSYFSDGCNPGRDLVVAIREAGFSSVEAESYMQDGAGLIQWVIRPHAMGRAIR